MRNDPGGIRPPERRGGRWPPLTGDGAEGRDAACAAVGRGTGTKENDIFFLKKKQVKKKKDTGKEPT